MLVWLYGIRAMATSDLATGAVGVWDLSYEGSELAGEQEQG